MGGKVMPVLAALFGSVVFAAALSANDSVNGHLGAPVSEATARAVEIDESTSLIKVNHFEAVTIENRKGQRFTWRFDTMYCPTGFPLKSIAPPDFDAGDAWVYVRPQPHSD